MRSFGSWTRHIMVKQAYKRMTADERWEHIMLWWTEYNDEERALLSGLAARVEVQRTGPSRFS